MRTKPAAAIRIDIVSDIMCPWCVVGFHQLSRAIDDGGYTVDLHWHPFELNPKMPAGGQNLRDHIAAKYASSDADSEAARLNLTELGTQLGFRFNFNAESRMWNSFLAHQLVEFADTHNAQHSVSLALFTAHFTEARDVSDPNILADIAAECGLERTRALHALTHNDHAQTVRALQAFWVERGITGVPAMIFASQHLLVGARGVDGYRAMLDQRAAD